MIYLLDTNSCIQYLNGRSPNIKQHFASVDPQDIVLCSVVKGELIYGAMKSQRPSYNLANLSQFFARFASLPFDDKASESYGQIRAALELAGTPIGPNDLFIAAVAVSNQVTLVTHNSREFSRVVGLQWVDWEV